MIDYSNQITPDNITELKPNEVFVFGSNLAGRHGRGAAKQALDWGARYGQGSGRWGNTYAIATKGWRLEVRPLWQIGEDIADFAKHAKNNPEKTFLVTEIGCGLACYTPEQIAPLFKPAIEIPNIHLPKRFWEVLLKEEK